MPQPLPAGKSVHFGPNRILKRPEQAAHMGNVCANWSLIEGDMVSLYALLMGTYLPSVAGFSPPAHPVAYQVFDSLNALGPRLDLLNRLCRWRAQEAEADHLQQVLSPFIRKRYAERSRVAHGQWGICEEYPDALMLMQTFGATQIWKQHDFEELSERIVDLHMQLLAFTAPINKRLWTPAGAVDT